MSRIDAVAELSESGSATLSGIRTSGANNTDAEIAAATKAVERNAADEGEADELLKMLGLREPGFRWDQSLSAKGAGHKRKLIVETEDAG